MSLMVVAFTSNEAEYAEMFADILAILREVHSSLLVVVLYETSLERIFLGWLSISMTLDQIIINSGLD